MAQGLPYDGTSAANSGDAGRFDAFFVNQRFVIIGGPAIGYSVGSNSMMTLPEHELDGSPTAEFYKSALALLSSAGIPFLVGGSFALQRFTGLARDTKDIDIFVKPDNVNPALAVFEDAGYSTELPYPHWLAKAHCGDHFMDIIFSSGNGLATVDDEWFASAPEAEVMGLQVKLSPVEEIIWSKAFVMERERYDGADVAHLLHVSAGSIDWQRLIRRFADHWQVLFSHLILFDYIYPSKRDLIPAWVREHLLARAQTTPQPPQAQLCRGTYLSRAQYLPDITDWGYHDARVLYDGSMTTEEAEIWTTAAIEDADVTISIASDVDRDTSSAA